MATSAVRGSCATVTVPPRRRDLGGDDAGWLEHAAEAVGAILRVHPDHRQGQPRPPGLQARARPRPRRGAGPIGDRIATHGRAFPRFRDPPRAALRIAVTAPAAVPPPSPRPATMSTSAPAPSRWVR
jgi:hypothetical protein